MAVTAKDIENRQQRIKAAVNGSVNINGQQVSSQRLEQDAVIKERQAQIKSEMADAANHYSNTYRYNGEENTLPYTSLTPADRAAVSDFQTQQRRQQTYNNLMGGYEQFAPNIMQNPDVMDYALDKLKSELSGGDAGSAQSQIDGVKLSQLEDIARTMPSRAKDTQSELDALLAEEEAAGKRKTSGLLGLSVAPAAWASPEYASAYEADQTAKARAARIAELRRQQYFDSFGGYGGGKAPYTFGIDLSKVTRSPEAIQRDIDELDNSTAVRDYGNADVEARLRSLQAELARAERMQAYNTKFGDVDISRFDPTTQKPNGDKVHDLVLGVNSSNRPYVMSNGQFAKGYLDAVNGSTDAEGNIVSGGEYGGKSYFLWMDNEERVRYLTIYDRDGKELADDYIQTIRPTLEEREASKNTERLSKWAYDNPVLGSAASVAMAPAKGISYLGQAVDLIGDGKINENAGYQWFSRAPSTLRSAVTQKVEENYGEVGSFLYGTGMSFADFLVTTGIGAGNEALTLAIMGSGAAADTVLDAKQRGLSDGQAFTLGTAAGLAEVVTEKVSLEAFLDRTNMDKNLFGYMLKNVISEGSEEGASDVLNLIADSVISGDLSELRQSIEEYKMQAPAGVDAQKWAEQQAMKDWFKQFGLDVAGGALSGFGAAGMGVGATAVQNAFASQQMPSTYSAPGSTQYIEADDIIQQLVGSGADEATAGELAPVLASVINGESISGNAAARIAENEAALGLLEYELGVEINTDAPISEVKREIQALANRSEGTTQSAADNLPRETQTAQNAENAAGGESVTVAEMQQRNAEAVRNVADTLGTAGKNAMTSMYNDGTNADGYISDMLRAYNAGRNGVKFENIGVFSNINPSQAEAAYIAGQADGNVTGNVASNSQTQYNNINNNQEEMNDGRIRVRGSGQWNDSQSATGETGRVEGQAGRNTPQSRRVQSRPAAVQRAIPISSGQVRTTASLGIRGGSNTDRIGVLTDDNVLNAEQRRQVNEARRIVNEYNARRKEGDSKINLVMVYGGNLNIDGVSARGFFDGSTLFVRVDHYRYTADQLTLHEVTHADILNGNIDLSSVRGNLTTSEDSESILNAYLEAYASTGLRPDQIWEEVVCDAVAGMNDMSGKEFGEEAGRWLADVRSAAISDAESRRNITRGPPTESIGGKMSRNLDERGRALRPGEMVNEFRDKINWKNYYKKIQEDKFNPDLYDDGERAVMELDGQFLVLEMQENGEFSVIRTNGTEGNYGKLDSYRQLTSSGNGEKGLSGERRGNSGGSRGNEPGQSGGNTRQSVGLRDTETGGEGGTDVSQGLTSKFSQELDADYMAAIDSGDTEAAQRMVDEAAKAAGYDSPLLYHGTESFGFTEFDLSKMDDNRSIFLTSSKDIASTYSGVEGGRQIGKQTEADIDNMPIKDVVDQLNSLPEDSMQYRYSLMDIAASNKLIQTVNEGVEGLRGTVSNLVDEYSEKMASNPSERTEKIHRQLVSLNDQLSKYQYSKISTPLYMLLHHTDVFGNNGAAVEELDNNIRLLNKIIFTDVSDGVVVQQGLGGYTVQVLSHEQARTLLQNGIKKGNYSLYAKLGNSLEIDAKGRYWNDINFTPKYTADDVYLTEDESSYQLRSKRTGEVIIDHNFGSGWPSMSADAKMELALYSANLFASSYESTRDISKYAQEKGYDSVVFKNLKDNGGRNDMIDTDTEADIYIVFNPNDVKSADPVTYDAEGNVIPLSERFNTGNSDIRFSRDLESVEALDRENRDLRKRLTETMRELRSVTARAEQLAGQMKRTTEPTLRQDDIKKLANSLVKSAGSSIKGSDITAELTELGEFILRGGNETDELTWSGVKERADKIAGKLIESAEVLREDGNEDTYREIRDYLKNVKMSISYTDSRDIADYGAWRKSVFNKINVKIDGPGMGVDQAYQELHGMAPWLFPDDVTHPADMLLTMQDALSSMEPVFENPYSYNMAEAVEWMSNEIVDSLLDDTVRQTSATFADKAAAKLDAQKAADAAKLQQLREVSAQRLEKQKRFYQEQREAALQRVRDQRDRKMNALKQHYAEMAQRSRDRAADRAARQRLLKIARRLQNKKLPLANKALLNQYIGELYTVATSITDRKRNQLEGLKELYEAKTTVNGPMYDPNWRPDPAMKKKLDDLAKIEAKGTISDMSLDQVLDLTQVLEHMDFQLSEAAKFQSSEERRENYAAGISTITEIEDATPMNKATEKVFYRSLSPERFVRRIVGYADGSIAGSKRSALITLAREMTKGEESFDIYQREAHKLFSEYLNDRKFMQSIYGKNAQAAEVTGVDARTGETKTIKITRAQLIDLYCNLFNDDNLDHLEYGGGKFLDYDALKKGDKTEAERRAVTLKLKKTDIQAATSKMTAKERGFAKQLDRYYNDYAPTQLNEASLKLSGYERFLVENYYPISTDRDFLNMNFEAMASVEDGNVSLSNPGFAQERVSSKKPIYILNANERLESSIVKNGRYATMAVPLMNMSKLLNMQMASWDNTRNFTSVKQTLNDKFGKAAIDYLSNYMRQYAGHTQHTDTTADRALNKLRSNYSGGVLVLGAGTAIKQAASYPTAAAVVSAKSLAQAFEPKKINLDYIDKMTAAYTKRAEGFSTLELAELTQQGKHIPKALNWIQGMDMATTNLLKRAAFFEVASTRKDLERNSPEFKQAVVDMYIRIIEETQPNYSTALRPEILRSENALERSLVMFATQPLQNFNILYDAQQNYAAKAKAAKVDPNNAEVQAAKKAAGKQLAKAVTSQTAASLVFSLMQYLWDFIREKDDKYRDKEGEITVLSSLKGIGINMLGNGVGMLPYMKPVLEIVESITDGVLKSFGKDPFFEQAFYGWDVASVSALNDAVTSAVSAILKVADATIKAAAGNEENPPDWESAVRKSAKALEDVCVLFGVPAGNVKQLIRVVGFKAIRGIVKDKYQEEYYIGKWAGDSKSAFYANLWAAYKSGRQSYDDLRALMESDGDFSAAQINTAIKSYIKDELTAGKLSDEDTAKVLTDIITKTADGEAVPMTEKDAWDAIRTWRTGSAYGTLDAALVSGERNDYTAAYNEMIAHGYSRADFMSKLKARTKALFEAGEITKQTATNILTNEFKEIDKWGSEKKLSSDDIYWLFKSWETGDSARYGDLESALESNNASGVRQALSELTNHGYDESDVMSKIKSYTGELYKHGTISKNTATDMLNRYYSTTDETGEKGSISENELYWLFDKWDGGEDYYKYGNLYSAMDSGNNVKAEVGRYTEHGVSEAALKSAITNHYKQLYIDGDSKTRDSIIKAMVSTGLYTLGGAMKKGRDWTKK